MRIEREGNSQHPTFNSDNLVECRALDVGGLKIDYPKIASAKLGKTLFSIPSANVGYCRVQPRLRSFALLTRLLLSPRLRCALDFPIGGSGRSSLCANQR